MAQSILITSEAVSDSIKSFSAIEMDELVLWHTVADMSQLDGLAEVIANL